MEPVVITNDEELDKAMAEMDAFKGFPERGTLDYLRWRELVDAIQRYEDVHAHIGPGDPVSAIEFRMDQGGLRQKDLIPYIGPAPRVSEILSRKRTLTLPMIRRLHKGLGIPLASLCAEPREDDDWEAPERSESEVATQIREYLSTDEGKRKLSQSLLQDIRLRHEMYRVLRPYPGGTLFQRPTITEEHIAKAVKHVYERTMKLMRGVKGPGAFVSIHEAMGKLHEEVREVEEAVHGDDAAKVADEMLDVAVAAVFTVACFDAGVFGNAR